jgi:hypothetical protein
MARGHGSRLVVPGADHVSGAFRTQPPRRGARAAERVGDDLVAC